MPAQFSIAPQVQNGVTQPQPVTGSCAAQNVDTSGSYNELVVIDTSQVRQVSITGIVGGTGPLTGLQLTFASMPGGQHVPALKDSDFSTCTDTLLRSLNLATPTNIPTGTSFQFTVDLSGTVAEIGLWAKSTAGATVAVQVMGKPDRS